MKNLILSAVLCALSASSYAQRVETLVPGPSSFDDGLAVDASGFIYASRYYGTTVTKISPTGETSVFSSGFGSPNAIAFDNEGNLIVPNATGNKVHRVFKDGTKEVILPNIQNPTGIAVDSIGNIFISQYSLSRISKLDTAGTLTTFLTGGKLNGPVTLIFDEQEDLFIGNFNDGKILKYSFENDEVSEIADIPGWLGSFTLTDSTIYATAFENHSIYKINKDGSKQSIFSGNGVSGKRDGNLSRARFDGPNGIVVSNTGDTLFISDFGSRSLRMITGIIPNNPKIRIDSVLSFGEVGITIVVTDTMIIQNPGNDTLIVSDITSNHSNFTVDNHILEVPAYSSMKLPVSFSPTDASEYQAIISFKTNIDSLNYEFTVRGIGINVTSNEEENNLVQEYKLFQNYPNPFNPSTTINFTLPQVSDVSLQVFDIQGRLVSTLVEGELQAGYYSKVFNASSLATGIYSYRLVVGSKVIVRKLTLIK